MNVLFGLTDYLSVYFYSPFSVSVRHLFIHFSQYSDFRRSDLDINHHKISSLSLFHPSPLMMYSFERSREELKKKETWYYPAVLQAVRVGLAGFTGLHIVTKLSERRLSSKFGEIKRPFFGVHGFYCSEIKNQGKKNFFSSDYFGVNKLGNGSVPAALDLATLQMLRDFINMTDEDVSNFMKEWLATDCEFATDNEILMQARADRLGLCCKNCICNHLNDSTDTTKINPILTSPVYKLYFNELKLDDDDVFNEVEEVEEEVRVIIDKFSFTKPEPVSDDNANGAIEFNFGQQGDGQELTMEVEEVKKKADHVYQAPRLVLNSTLLDLDLD